MSNINELCEADFKKFAEENGIEKHLLDEIKNIFTFAYFFGDDYLNERPIKFSEISKQKRNMFSHMLMKYGEEIHQLSTEAFKIAYDIASKREGYVSKKIPGPYYNYEFDLDFFSCYDNHTIIAVRELLSAFSNAFDLANKKSGIVNLTLNIVDTQKFKEILSNNEWSNTFKKYCYSVFTQWINLSYFDLHRSQIHIMDYEKLISTYKKTLDDLELEMKNRKFEDAIIKFHMKYVVDLLHNANIFSGSDECSYLINKEKWEKKYNEEEGILRLESFISANTFGF